ncbi:MAG: NADH-quinone oxidoreductase subunit A [Cycloclasticus sp.]|nr:MAG: NADH-quinone oxidoreductase subunit A [Cycloclasticus sp.]
MFDGSHSASCHGFLFSRFFLYVNFLNRSPPPLFSFHVIQNIACGGDNLNEANISLGPFVVYFLAVLAFVGTTLFLSHLLGQRRANAATNVPFESGALSVGSPQIHMAVEFYLIAIFFVIFDLETVFIFAWAVAFFELGWSGFAAIGLFIFILTVALVYELRSGALDWGIKTRTGSKKGNS